MAYHSIDLILARLAGVAFLFALWGPDLVPLAMYVLRIPFTIASGWADAHPHSYFIHLNIDGTFIAELILVLFFVGFVRLPERWWMPLPLLLIKFVLIFVAFHLFTSIFFILVGWIGWLLLWLCVFALVLGCYGGGEQLRTNQDKDEVPWCGFILFGLLGLFVFGRSMSFRDDLLLSGDFSRMTCEGLEPIIRPDFAPPIFQAIYGENIECLNTLLSNELVDPTYPWADTYGTQRTPLEFALWKNKSAAALLVLHPKVLEKIRDPGGEISFEVFELASKLKLITEPILPDQPMRAWNRFQFQSFLEEHGISLSLRHLLFETKITGEGLFSFCEPGLINELQQDFWGRAAYAAHARISRSLHLCVLMHESETHAISEERLG